MGKRYLRLLLFYSLKCHNFFYDLSSRLSVKLEPGGKLHPKHRLMDYHEWFIKQLKPDWEVLDAGCGNGALAADLSRYCRKITGIDISQENIKDAKERLDADFICSDATTYDFKRRFDAVILSNVLEHISDRVFFLKKLVSVSDIFLIRVPMIDRDWITLYKKELGIEYKLDPTHSIEYTFEGFVKELEESGLAVESFRIRYGEIYAVARKTTG